MQTDSSQSKLALRQRLGEKLPEILIEAGSVLLGLLLAFGANAWHEHSEDMDRADKARTAILAELRENRKTFATSREAVARAVAELEKIEKDESPAHGSSIDLNIQLAIFSEAAWRTAQATQATRNLDYAWLIDTSQFYELQTMYTQMQWSVVERLADIDSFKIETKADVAHQFLGRLHALADLGKGLEASYAEMLDKPPGATQDRK